LVVGDVDRIDGAIRDDRAAGGDIGGGVVVEGLRQSVVANAEDDRVRELARRRDGTFRRKYNSAP